MADDTKSLTLLIDSRKAVAGAAEFAKATDQAGAAATRTAKSVGGLDRSFKTMAMALGGVLSARLLVRGAEGLIGLYNFLIENTAAGREALQAAEAQEQVIQDITSELEALGENMTREQFMDLVLRHAEDDQHIQALVGVMRKQDGSAAAAVRISSKLAMALPGPGHIWPKFCWSQTTVPNCSIIS